MMHSPVVLNIGRLGNDINEIVKYYVDSAPLDGKRSSTERYYLDHGHAPGRWVGSLCPELGLSGAVDAESFRLLLIGADQRDQKPLNRVGRHSTTPASRRSVLSVDNAATFTVKQTAERLGVTQRHVRRLLMQGERLDEAERVANPASYLVGTRGGVRHDGPGRPGWVVPVGEVQRFEKAHNANSARPGFDLTLRPTKSVSLLWALGRPQQSAVVARAHREAVDLVVDYYERQAVYSRKSINGVQKRIATGGIVGAAFDHRTSRAGDPLLHTHVVTFNVTKAVDGKWRALDGTPLYEHARSAGYLYQTHMRAVLSRELGVRWTPVAKGTAEIEGIPQHLIKDFSKRRNEIEAAVADAGHTSPRAHQVATLSTRRPKEAADDPKAEIQRWQDEAGTLGFTAEHLDACIGRTTERAIDQSTSQEAFKRLFEELASSTGLTEMASTFTRRDVICQIIDRQSPTINPDAIETVVDQFIEGAKAVPLTTGLDVVLDDQDNEMVVPGLTRFSTAELLHKEAALLEWASSDRERMALLDCERAAMFALSHPSLSDEQAQLVRAVCTHKTEVMAISGRPGSGKTHAVGVAVNGLTGAGVPVVGVALSAEAACELEAATHLEERTLRPATTVAGLLMELNNAEDEGLAAGTVLIVDEASMVGTRDLYSLLQHVKEAHGSMILVGDPDQHGSVEAGGFYRRLVTTRPELVTNLVQNKRQVDEIERLALEDYRRGLIPDAMDRYDQAGKVVRSTSASESRAAMAKDWYERWSRGDLSPMIAGPNALRRQLNDRARAMLLEQGELSEPALVIGDRDYRVGDWVVARSNDRRLRGSLDGYVKNGSRGTVVALDQDDLRITVNFEREGLVVVPRSYLKAGHIEHGYARTTYGVQGKTLTHSAYLPTDASSFEEGYVALSRGKDDTSVYATQQIEDDSESVEDLIAKALERRRAKVMAHDLHTDIKEPSRNEMEIDMP